MLPHQRVGNAVVAALVRVLYGAAVHDVPPMRVVRGDVLDRLALVEDTYGWPTEMLVKTLRAGLPVAELPVVARTPAGRRLEDRRSSRALAEGRRRRC